MVDLSKSELKKYNGQGDNPAYVAYEGKVYDVTKSRLWKRGLHMNRHLAGEDLTGMLEAAPHKDDVFERVELVGELKVTRTEAFMSEALPKFIQKRHPHPVSVHFPIAYLIAAGFFSIIYVLTNNMLLETAAYYSLLLGGATSPIAIVAGYLSWRVTYQATMTSIFTKKIRYSVLLAVVLTITILWRTLDPGILTYGSASSWVYLLLVLSLTPTVILLGYYGGKLVYPSAF